MAFQLTKYRFETVTVDTRGEIIAKNPGEALVFQEEPLAKYAPGLEMVAISGGKFIMGSPELEDDLLDDPMIDSRPQHEVTIQPFFIGKYPVTQAQWCAISYTPAINRELLSWPSQFERHNIVQDVWREDTAKYLPVEGISWEEAIEFCQRLSRETGRDYRLPTEAEWEYACRAGTTTLFNCGETITSDLANYRGTEDDGIDTIGLGDYDQGAKGIYRLTTTPVDTFPPNAFGLYDMHGNVSEWCLDHWHDDYHGAPTDGSAWISDDNDAKYVARGGGCYYSSHYCCSASRDYVTPDDGSIVGFRVVCEIPG